MPQNRTLTPRQRKAVEALLATGEVAAAAREVGVSRDTLYRWMRQPLFVEAVRETEARALDELSRLLVRLGRTATATLAKAMSDPATPAATRVRAADVTLARLLQLRELATLEARVQALEVAAGISGEEGRR
jgi:transposase-like protein